MKRTPLRVIALVSLTLTLFSCATIPPGQEAGSAALWRDMPRFFMDPPDIYGVLYGLGLGTTMDEAMAMARDDLSTQLRTRVQVTNESLAAQETVDGESSYETSFEQRSQQISESVLEKAKRLDYKLSQNGLYYVLVYYPTDDASAGVENRIVAELDRQKRAHLWQTTIASGFLPGTGQLINRQTTKGALMLGTAIALAGTSVTAFILGAQDYQNALNASNDTETEYYNQGFQLKYGIGFAAAGLYAALGVYSAIDNFNAQR